jgi:hypothetical protein
MALTTTNAQISFQDGAGAVTNVSNGAVVQVTPGAPVTFALQNTSGVITWELYFIGLNAPGIMVQHSWKAGQANAITVQMPAYLATQQPGGAGVQIISVVGDGVQSIAQSINWLQTLGGVAATVVHQADVATFVALAAYTNVNGVLTATGNGIMAAIDGVTVVPGSRVLLTQGAAAADNGIYQVTSVGTAGSPYVLTLAPDWANSSVQLQGAVVEVNQGTVFGKSTWKATLAGPITVGTSAPAFYPRVHKFQVTLSGGAGAYAASWVLAATGPNGSKCLTTDTTSAAAVKATATAGAGNGTVSLVGTGTDVIDVAVINW